jgi:hypothetical protein
MADESRFDFDYPVECQRCRGSGVTIEKDDEVGGYDRVECPVCHGSGVARDEPDFDTDLLTGMNDLFSVTHGPVGYNVYLPHQCDSWDVVENATRDEAIDAMIKFIREARKALVELQTNGFDHDTARSVRPNLLAILTERTLELQATKMELLRWKLAH